MTPISQEWIKNYVDQLLAYAEKLPEGNTMRVAAMMRADHAMDLVKAWREKESREGGSSNG